MAEKARLLRAMVFADIVGYSALIAEDEDGALDLIGDYINLFQDHCTDNGGEIVGYRADRITNAAICSRGLTDDGLCI